MKRRVVIQALVMLSMGATAVSAQCASSHGSAKEIVEQLWSMATWGDLLPETGRDKAARSFFTDPAPSPDNKIVMVVSNQWGPPAERTVKADAVEIEVGFRDAGGIDSSLRYLPPKPTDAIKLARSYDLVLVPAYMMMYGPDGKTLTEKKPTGCSEWEIKGSLDVPWTTVNSAIRYVLEKRENTSDPMLKKNADLTLTELLKLH